MILIAGARDNVYAFYMMLGHVSESTKHLGVIKNNLSMVINGKRAGMRYLSEPIQGRMGQMSVD